MAEDKLTLASLRKALALKAGCTEEVAGTFLTHLFPAIVAGLKEDKQVRINGLGTFKLQWNEPRKSVNIRTGESIVIEGYNKVVFTPETSLKEQVNEPFAHLEAVVIDGSAAADTAPQDTKPAIDPMQKFSEQAEEIKDLLAELGGFEEEAAPAVEETVVTEEVVEIVTEETLAEESVVEEVVEETVEEETVVTTDTPAEETTEAIEEQPATETVVETEETTAEKPTTEEHVFTPKEKRPFNAWLVALITIAIFAVLLVGAFFFLQHKIVSWADSLLEKTQTTEVVVDETTEEAADVEAIAEEAVEEEVTSEEEVVTEENHIEEIVTEEAAVEELAAAPVDETTYEFTEFIGNEKLTQGSRLTWLSRKYYGAPDFWVYIYEANKEKIPNPNDIPVGTTIHIPQLPADWIDTHNEESMQRARALHNKILGK